MRQFLQQVNKGARGVYDSLRQNLSGAGDYMKTIPAVQKVMEDTKDLRSVGGKLYKAYKKRSRGEEFELPGIDELAQGAKSGQNTYKRFKSGSYKA